MGQIYRFLGLSVGCIVHGLTDEERREAYAADVTYGTNNEFGFDYLRDNMKYALNTMAQRGHAYAIVDEVDSILVDEARTPLIISGPTQDLTEMYRAVDAIMSSLAKADYDLDEKSKQVTLTESGAEHMVELLRAAGLLEHGDLYDTENISVVHHVNQALKAHFLFQRDRDYIVKNDQVIIIDEFTGRMMEGRRYSEGLHQALEAKEQVTVQPENVTLASITFQNYFRLYDKLAGMTGTAMTEAAEFMDIYKLDVRDIPTNMPVARIDYDDEVYRTADEKNDAIIKLIEICRTKDQPVLVGTTSIEKSEHLSELLKKRSIPHHVLNARYHEQEAFIVAQAGVPGAVTIATNMAGRGTDIQLGGNADMRIRHELATETDPAEREARVADYPRRGRRQQADGAGGGRPLRHRHRASREPAHRQSAARPLRPPGRSRRLEILPVAAGRSDAHLRFGADGCDPHPAGPRTRRSHHPSLGQQGAGKGAAESRSPQLRNPQEHPEVRQRPERPAQGDLRPAQGDHVVRRRLRSDRRFPRGSGRDVWSPATSRKKPMPSNGTPRGCTTK